MQHELRNARILIVDDELEMVRLLEFILRQAGYAHLRSTTNSGQAVGLFQEFQPDLVLQDLMMPALDGYAVLAQLKLLIPKDTYLPIMVLTADTSVESKQRVLQAGAQDYLNKPFDSTEVLLRIRNLLETRFLHLHLRHQIDQVCSGQERIQSLSQRLLNTQETERRHIAHELHDEIGQSLTALNINLHTALTLSQATSSQPSASTSSEQPALASLLKESIDIVQRVLGQVRTLSCDLQPAMLDDLGLVVALQVHVEGVAQRAGLEANFNANVDESRFSPGVEIVCFRLVQESLTNILRHAQAQHVEILLQQRQDNLELVIRDDGIGFDVRAACVKATNGNCLGLRAMKERVQLIGGRITFNSTPASETDHGGRPGTEIRVLLPLNHVARIAPLAQEVEPHVERADCGGQR